MTLSTCNSEYYSRTGW